MSGHGLMDSPLAAASRYLDEPAVLLAGSTRTWRHVHAASLALASQLPRGSSICNLCDSRLGFLVVWLACLRRGCVQLLPPSGAHADFLGTLESSVDPILVVDDARLLQPQWRDHARSLVHDPRQSTSARDDLSLAWEPRWDAPAACLYTSGSTGVPQAQPKTLGQLARGAQVLAARLHAEIEGGLPALRRLVCSVPPQHMFGLETSVMLPLMTGLPVVDGRPLLPGDVRQFFGIGQGVGWIATPLHLRAMAQLDESLPGCGLVLASTMPLAPALAAQTETLTGAPVMEIYGSTETGVVAMRRTARHERWAPVEGVQILSTSDGATRVVGQHFASPRQLGDEIEVDAEGGFRLLGRHGDLLKIAGRRASLQALNALLHDLPGLADGIFYLPANGVPTERLVLIYAGERLDAAATRRWFRGRIDPVFVPRTLIRVDRLPRSASGKLPRAALDALYTAHTQAERA